MESKFKSPDKEYTPYPFWFWNDELDEGEGFSSEILGMTFKSKINRFEIWDPWELTIKPNKLNDAQSKFSIQANQLVLLNRP